MEENIKDTIEYCREWANYFQTTTKQEPCIEISTENKFLPVFSKDANFKANLAAKSYITAGYQRFWNYYSKLQPEKRQHYEIILPSLPCHLHIDSEVMYGYNQTFKEQEKEIERGFLCHVTNLLKNLQFISEETEMNIETLVSSNEKKYSKHFIIRIRNKMFTNNFHVGAFMRRLETYILEQEGPKLKNRYYFIDELQSKGKVVKFFADMAIYTRYRNFRVYASSKSIGGYRPLRLEHQTLEMFTSQPVSKEIFFNTLIQYQDPTKKLNNIIQCLEIDGSEPVSMGCHITKLGDLEKNLPTGIKRPFFENTNVKTKFKFSKTVHVSSDSPESDFIYDIINEIETEWKEGLTIENYQYNHNFQTILFNTKHHACRMKRKGLGDPTTVHKNHIYFVAHLKQGYFVQHCFADNETCWKEVTDSYGNIKKVRSTSEKYYFSQQLSEKISKYISEISESNETKFAKIIISIYQQI